MIKSFVLIIPLFEPTCADKKEMHSCIYHLLFIKMIWRAYSYKKPCHASRDEEKVHHTITHIQNRTEMNLVLIFQM